MVDVETIVDQANANSAGVQPRKNQASASYFYARQLEGMIQQLIRTFSGFYYKTGVNWTGGPQLVPIPCKWGDASLMVDAIFKNNSENTAISAPMFAVYIKSISLAPEKRKFPVGEHTMQVRERGIDPTTNRYTNEPGASYQVDRLMAVPYDIRIQLDLYWSNASQQLQVMEQIMTMFNPSIQLQFSENPLDWTALTDLELEDIIYNTRAYPAGNDVTAIDVTSFTFVVKPFWLSPPAKVKKLVEIRTIIAKYGFDDQDCKGIITWDENDFKQSVTTPGEYKVSLAANQIILLNKFGSPIDKDGNIYEWLPLLNEMGSYNPETTIIRLRPGINIDYMNFDVIGTFVIDKNEPNKITVDFDPRTIPDTTIPNVINFIDPRLVYPGNGIVNPSAGDRYVVTNQVIPNTIAWGSFSAPEDSIIEWNGTQWTVADTFDSLPIGTIVLNLTNNKLYCSTSAGWVLAIEGIYSQGYWAIQYFEDYATQGLQ